VALVSDATAAGSTGERLPGFNRRQRWSSGARLIVAALAGAVVGVPAGAGLGWTLCPLVAWVVASAVFLVWTWSAVWPLPSAETARLSQREDPSGAVADLVLLVTAVAAMLAVALVIFRAGRTGSGNHRLRGGFDPGSLLVDPLDETAARKAQAPWVDNAQNDQVGTVLHRQLDRLIGGPVGDGRQVRAQQDPADRIRAAGHGSGSSNASRHVHAGIIAVLAPTDQ